MSSTGSLSSKVQLSHASSESASPSCKLLVRGAETLGSPQDVECSASEAQMMHDDQAGPRSGATSSSSTSNGINGEMLVSQCRFRRGQRTRFITLRSRLMWMRREAFNERFASGSRGMGTDLYLSMNVHRAPRYVELVPTNKGMIILFQGCG